MEEIRERRSPEVIKRQIEEFGSAPEKAVAMELAHLGDEFFIQLPKLISVLERIAIALEKKPNDNQTGK